MLNFCSICSIFVHFLDKYVKQIETKANLSRLKIVVNIQFVGCWLIFMPTVLEGQIDFIIWSLSFLWQWVFMGWLHIAWGTIIPAGGGNGILWCVGNCVSDNLASHCRRTSLTYLLTSWSRVRLEQLTGFQLVKKFSVFYGTRRFITAFTSAPHLSLSQKNINSQCIIFLHVTNWYIASSLLSLNELRWIQPWSWRHCKPKVLLPTFQTMWCQNPEDCCVKCHCIENLRCSKQ